MKNISSTKDIDKFAEDVKDHVDDLMSNVFNKIFEKNTHRMNYFHDPASIQNRLPEQHVRWLASSVFTNVNHPSGTGALGSIFHLLGFLGECLALAPESDVNKYRKEFKAWFDHIRSFPAYVERDFSLGDGKEQEVDTFESDDNESEFTDAGANAESTSDFFDKMVVWRQQVAISGDVILPPAILGKVWGRFYYALSEMDKEIDSRLLYTGEILSQQVVAFLHALLTEELAYRGHDVPTFKNSVISPDQFMRNLDYYSGLHGDAQRSMLFHHILNWPVWKYFFSNRIKVAASKGNIAVELVEPEMVQYRVIDSTFNDKGAVELTLCELLNMIPVVVESLALKTKNMKKRRPSEA